MKRNFICIVIIVLTIAMTGCGTGGKQADQEKKQISIVKQAGQETQTAKEKPQEIIVFAASSLTESFNELAGEFEEQENGNCKVILNFSGSQALKTLIETGVKADIFASASTGYMDDLKEQGFVSDYSIFARNRLVLIRNRKSSFPVSKLGDLAVDGLRIAAGDSSVPVGMYWEQALEAASKNGELSGDEVSAVENNIKTRELNVKDVVSKVVINEADVGVVYRTDVTEKVAGKVQEIDIPVFGEFSSDYPAAILIDSENNIEAQKFYHFLLSEKGKEILGKYKFITDK